MSVLMRAHEITGRPVVTLDTAEAVAEVKDVVIAHGAAEVVGFTLNGRGFLSSPLREVLPWTRVGALGRDAVMVDGADALTPPDAAMEEAAAAARERDIVGATVMTDGGTALGTVVDGPGVERDRDAATLLIPVDDTIAVSGSTLLVPAAAEGFVRDDLSGFGSAVADFRARLREEGS
jgi:sporulation protein YlmC with PRC-barrel domain